VPQYDWILLAVSLAAVALGLIWAGFQGYRAWRRGYPAFKRLSAASEELNVRAAALEQRMAALEEKGALLQRYGGRLAVSLTRARILLAAIEDARRVADGVLAFVPRS
jgi:hypothetical protein